MGLNPMTLRLSLILYRLSSPGSDAVACCVATVSPIFSGKPVFAKSITPHEPDWECHHRLGLKYASDKQMN